MRRRTQKRNKSHLKRYTALVPKTLRATKAASTSVIKKINYFLNNTANAIRKTTKKLDKATAKSIRSLTKRRTRK
jgi:hypothetical protein